MRQTFTNRGGHWVVLQFVCMAMTALVGPLWPGHWPGIAPAILAGLLGVVGAVVGICGVITLGRQRTAYPTPKPDGELIRHGIYAHIRHPLYASLILLGLAWAAWWRSPATFGSVAAMVIVLHAKTRVEERALRERFREYADYERQVARFFPGI